MGYYDKQGQPISMDEYFRLWPDEDYKRIGADQVGDTWVSTVWLGSDHGYGDLQIFETMCFGGKFDQDMVRYGTLEEAQQGHQTIVYALKTIKYGALERNARVQLEKGKSA